MSAPDEKTRMAASKYIQAFESLALIQHSMLELTHKNGDEEPSLDPKVWELVGAMMNKIHGEEAYNMVPIVMLAIDIYLYSINKLDEENFFDVVERIDTCIQNLKRNVKIHLHEEKEKGGGWIN